MDPTSVIEILKANGLKITSQRKAIIDVLVELKQLHPSVFLIYAETKKKIRSVSLSTVYNMVNEFCRLGILTLLGFDGKESRCETNPGEHVHLICEKCGAILDCAVPSPLQRDSLTCENGFTITRNRLEYYGVCRDCLQGRNAAPNHSVRKLKPVSTDLRKTRRKKRP